MDLFYQWCQSNMDIIFLIYGLAFVTMGVAILVQPKKESGFELANILWLLVAYAFIHAPADFFSMRAVIKEETTHIPEAILTSISYLFLFEFGRRLMGFTKKAFCRFRWILPIIVSGILLAGALSDNFWTLLNVLVGYFIRFPAGVMSGLGFIFYYNSLKKRLKPLKVKKYFYWAGISLLAWSFFCGIVRAKGTFFPSNWLNTDSFCLVVGVPVQIFRTICAVIATWAIVGMLRIFIGEKIRIIQEALTMTERITDGIQEGIMLIDKDFKILWANKKQKELFGEVEGDYCYQVTHRRDSPCQPPNDTCPILEIQKTNEFSSVVHNHFDKQGNSIFVEVTAYPIKDETGETVKFVHVSRDITERKRQEERIKIRYDIENSINLFLRLSLRDIPLDEFLENALDIIISNIPYLSFKPMGSIFLVEDNSGVLVMKAQKGFSAFHQKTCAIVPLGKCICGRAALTKKVEFTNCVDKIHEITYEDMFPHGHYCVPIIFTDKVLGVINMYVEEGHAHNQEEEDFLRTLADVLAGVIVRNNAKEDLIIAYDKLKAMQAQLIQASKMSGIGSLASGVAHEINNPLTGVLNNVQLIKMSIAQDKNLNTEDFKELLDSIEESAQRCVNITRALLDFGRPSKGVFQPISIKEITGRVLILVRHNLEMENIKIQRDIEPNLPEIKCDTQLLQQAIFDIISNAQWAIQKKSKEAGGIINIKASYNPDKDTVDIYISDTGIGISEDNLKRIFEPFFTTKGVGEGTGLGLFMVYNIIKEHKGNIEAESKLSEGTTFKISLPAG